jgi:hypothetical protein
LEFKLADLQGKSKRSWEMRSGLTCVIAALAAVLVGPACLAQTDTPEIEPNESKAAATVVPSMAPGDTLSGTCTGTGTAPGIASLDTWNINTTPAGTPGIYEYRLVINDTGTTGHTISLRGLTQTNGAIGTSDIAVQNVPPATAHFVKWFANEQPSNVYFRIFGTSATSAPYSVVLQRFPVTVVQVPNPVDAGPVYISTIGQTLVNTDLWLYDANLNAIFDAGNDNETVASGGTGATQLSRLQRSLSPGTYILAISATNLANYLPSPEDDGNRNSPVMDSANAICTSTAIAGDTDLDFVIGNRCSGNSQSVSVTAQFMEVKFVSFTVAAPELPDPVVLTAGSATPASVGQGLSTLLTVTATGGFAGPVTADLSAFGLTTTEAFHDDGLNGDAVAGDGIWSYTLNVSGAQPTASYSVNVTGTSGGCVPPTRTITMAVTPPNNACANAVPIEVGGSYLGTTLGAVGSGGSSTNCNTIGGTGPGVWYIFTETSPTPRRLMASLCDPVTNFDAQMVLYTGSCGSFSCVWGNDTSGLGCPFQNPATETTSGTHTNLPVIINWTPGTPANKCTVPGQTYYLCVLNRAVATGGNFVLHLEDTGETCEGVPPANDLCTGARPLTTFPTWDVVFRDSATPDANTVCTDPSSNGARGSIWYTMTPSSPGDLFHAKIPDQGAVGSSTDTVVTVFSANPDCSNLTEVACVDAVEGYANRFTTPIASLLSHTTYYIEVSNFGATAAIPGGETLGFNFVPTGLSPCCRSDFNGDGDVGTDADIDAFFACLGGDCCPTCPPNADFNCDGDVGTDADIDSFFRVLAGGPC